MEINTIINVIAIILAVGNFICLYRISKKKAYYEEKGKNLATQEDIDKITDAVESIKDNYNKALESHKVELQKEFEKSKYYISLCQKIDEKLIEILLECHALSEEAISLGGTVFLDRKDIERCLYPLFNFLTRYSSRYYTNQIVNKILKLSKNLNFITENYSFTDIQVQVENGDFDFEKEYFDISADILFNSSQLLSEFLPPLSNNKPEQ